MTESVVALLTMLVLFGLGFLVGSLYARIREREVVNTDSVLMIKPPRVFVDDDGRSDFRPELREAADRRRAQKEGWR